MQVKTGNLQTSEPRWLYKIPSVWSAAKKDDIPPG